MPDLSPHAPTCRPAPRRRSRRRHAGLVAALVLGGALVAGCLAPEGERSLDLLVGERSSRGLSSLHNQGVLNDKAQGWADELARRGALAHSDLGAGVPAGWSTLGENVGVGRSVDEVHRSFMASDRHRGNILGSRYSRVGIGVATSSDGRVFVVQVFWG